MTHTPGPWREFHDVDSHDIMTLDGQHIAKIEPAHSIDAKNEQRDNGCLIASAPDLLAALEELLICTQQWPDGRLDNAQAAARAAITKATES